MEERDYVKSREAILNYIDRLSGEFVERRSVLELMAVAMAANEPMLLLGPPGTAKTAVITKFCKGLGLGETDYFEYMITAFTEPSEILGPVDIKALREEGDYRRMLEGKIADARIVFLDEIFNGNSAILNTLLTIMNERKVYQGGTVLKLEALAGFFAATNRIPRKSELAALKDRFVIKIHLSRVNQNHFHSLLRSGLKSGVNKELNRMPWVVPDAVSLADFKTVRRFIQGRLNEHYSKSSDADIIPKTVLNKYFYLTQELIQKGIFISDRESVKLLKIIITAGFLLNGHMPESITDEDLFVLKYIAETKEQAQMVEKCVDDALGY